MSDEMDYESFKACIAGAILQFIVTVNVFWWYHMWMKYGVSP